MHQQPYSETPGGHRPGSSFHPLAGVCTGQRYHAALADIRSLLGAEPSGSDCFRVMCLGFRLKLGLSDVSFEVCRVKVHVFRGSLYV